MHHDQTNFRAITELELDHALGRFARAVDTLGLADDEVTILLELEDRKWPRSPRTWTPHRVAESRLRLLTEIASLSSTLLGDASRVAAWIRAPNPGLPGRVVPLAALLADPTTIRSLRDALARELGDSW